MTSLAELTFEESEHIYHYGGVRVPSVTQVLDGMVDYDRVPIAKLRHAAERGTAVHLATEFDDEGDLDESTVDPEVLPYVDAWRCFRAESGFQPMRSEVRVYSARHRFAGTFDCLGVLFGKWAIVEKKTTFQLAPATAIQVSAYMRAYNEDKPEGERARACWSVWLRRNGTYRLTEYDPLEHWAAFLARLNPDDPQSAATMAAWMEKHG